MSQITTSTIIRDLQYLGLDHNEALVYFAGLQLRSFTVANLAQKAKIKRPTCYLLVESLVKKNFFILVPDAKVRRFNAINPALILNTHKKAMLSLDKTIKTLSEIRVTNDSLPTVEIYKGNEGVKQIFDTILIDKPDIVFGLINPKTTKEYLGENYINEWTKKRVSLGIKRQMLQSKDLDIADVLSTRLNKLRETYLLPSGFNYSASLNIWNNKVAFMSDKKEGINFVVTSKEFAKMMLSIFEALKTVSD